MASFVLVHGSFQSAWHWRRLTPFLGASGQGTESQLVQNIDMRIDRIYLAPLVARA